MRQQELPTEYVKGVMQGLTLSIALTTAFWEETKHQPVPNPSGKRKS